MLFNTYEFFIFLVTVFAVYWLIKPLRLQNLWVVAVSLFFYAWWDWRFLFLMLVVMGSAYGSGLLLASIPAERKRRRKGVVWAMALMALAVLGAFKYYDFFAGEFRLWMLQLGWDPGDLTLHLVLPVGISFYTLQALSYTIDVYRGTVTVCRKPVIFMAFISFFPQLVAGPIERAGNLLPQFERRRTFDYALAVSGLRLMLWGLFKKVVVADGSAPSVQYIFDNWQTQNVPTLIAGLVLFTFQIYCDFSGYSDIAIGVGRLFGIRLMRNFATPYFAKSIPEFWSRWHISLSSWLKDYVYIPLGGGRVGKWKKVRNLIVTFGVSGIWHGAGWTYLTWGLIHSGLNIPYVWLKKVDRKIAAAGKYLPTMREVWLMLITFFLVVMTRLPYRAGTLVDAWGYFKRMVCSLDFSGGLACSGMALMWCMLLMLADWIGRERECPLDFAGHGLMRYRWARWTLYYAIVALLLLFPGETKNFIYFQF